MKMRILSILVFVSALLIGTGVKAQQTGTPVVKFGATEVKSGTISVQTVQALANGGITLFPAPPVAMAPKSFELTIRLKGLKDEVSFISDAGKISEPMKKALMTLKAGDIVTINKITYNFNGESVAPDMTFTVN